MIRARSRADSPGETHRHARSPRVLDSTGASRHKGSAERARPQATATRRAAYRRHKVIAHDVDGEDCHDESGAQERQAAGLD